MRGTYIAIQGYDTVAVMDMACNDHARVLVLCNNSTHYIIVSVVFGTDGALVDTGLVLALHRYSASNTRAIYATAVRQAARFAAGLLQ